MNKESSVQIVVLQRGWVAVGIFRREGDQGTQCVLEKAKIIRRWGTSKGLGQLALDGPQKDTVLDDAGTMRFHELTIVHRLDVSNSDAWKL